MNHKAIVMAAMLLSAPAAAAEDVITFKGEDAVAFADDGTAMLRGSKDYLLQMAGNPEGKAFAYDAERRMVRLSPPDKTGIWVSCSELNPTAGICGSTSAAPRHRPSRGGNGGGIQMPAPGAVPSCPGDPRCPQVR